MQALQKTQLRRPVERRPVEKRPARTRLSFSKKRPEKRPGE